jgi:prepilin-type N-terminal cleavage/methylation domain-containing protein
MVNLAVHKIMFRRLFKNEKGFSLIEVLIGMLILGMIAATFIGGMNTVLTTSFRNSRQVHALALAQSQMEYIKQQDYNHNDTDSENNKDWNNDGAIDTDDPNKIGKYLLIDSNNIEPGYSIYGWDGSTPVTQNGKLVANFAKFWDIPPSEEGQPPPEGGPSETDTGLQRICVVIKHQSTPEPVVTLYGFKVDREFPQE